MTNTKTTQIVELLRIRHPAPEWATFVELANSTGYQHSVASRRLDFYAFNVWPSKKFWRVAYEIKVTRGDFDRELTDPSKRQFAWDFSNEAFFATPAGMVLPDEVPEGWGLVELTKGGLRKKKQAQQHEIADPLPLFFVASLARQSGMPPNDLPAVLWQHAGGLVTKEQLCQIAQTAWKTELEYAKREGVREFRASEGYEQLNTLRRLVRERIGWDYIDPAKFEEWLTDVQNGSAAINRATLDRLLRARDAINVVLEGEAAT